MCKAIQGGKENAETTERNGALTKEYMFSLPDCKKIEDFLAGKQTLLLEDKDRLLTSVREAMRYISQQAQNSPAITANRTLTNLEEEIAKAKELLVTNPHRFQGDRKTIPHIIAYIEDCMKRLRNNDPDIDNPDLWGFLEAIAGYLEGHADLYPPDADWDLVYEIIGTGLSECHLWAANGLSSSPILVQGLTRVTTPMMAVTAVSQPPQKMSQRLRLSVCTIAG